jgi:uroporphyrinogen decarboxylase
MNDPKKTSPSHLLIRAARGEVVERPPVWAMRQAGRWDPEFNRLRAGLSFYEFSENVELSAKASLLPRRFGVDAIILFYDITTLAVAMGLPFVLRPAQGPVPDHPVRTLVDVERLEAQPDPERFDHIRKLLAGVRAELRDELPAIVFAGAPFTLATYCIGTGKDLEATRRFVAEQPAVWEGLLDKLTTATVHFLGCLAREGAALYQLFDSWAGMLEPAEYDRWAQPRHQHIFAAVREVPRAHDDVGSGRDQPRHAARPGSGAAAVSEPGVPGKRRRGIAAERDTGTGSGGDAPLCGSRRRSAAYREPESRRGSGDAGDQLRGIHPGCEGAGLAASGLHAGPWP